MPGGGGLNGANYCYNVAPKDGSVICQISPSVPTAQLLDNTGIRYDAAKFNWIGQSADQNGALAIWHTSRVRTFEDTRKSETILGVTGRSSETFIDPTIFNAALGTKFKLVAGYRSAGDLNLAMERGEIHGYNGPILTYLSVSKQLVDDGRIRLIVQMGLRKQPKFPDVPLAAEFATDAESRALIEFIAARAQVGRAFVAPPGVPADRVAALRAAFDTTMKDPAFLDVTGKIGFEINPASGTEITKVVSQILATPDRIVKRAAAILH
jgi:tripartite-type tricarboxylate transporter receptor subunit TctC